MEKVLHPLSNSNMAMDILSAEIYPEPVTSRAGFLGHPGNGANQQPLGGLLATISRRSTRQRNAQTAYRLQKALEKDALKTKTNQGGAGTRQRGRPRLDPGDRTMAK